jgi:thiol-disulfide isomerase/thioredoxin
MRGPLFMLIVASVLLVSMPVHAEPVGAGDPLPAISLTGPEVEAQRTYLGLKKDGPFNPADISAELVIVEIFSMYCPHCQREAPKVNQLYQLLLDTPRLGNRVKLIGIGVGNSPMEVDFFRDTYEVRFPLFPDGDFAIHKALGEPRTPYFMGIKLGPGGKADVVYAKLGEFADPARFVDEVMAKAGMK